MARPLIYLRACATLLRRRLSRWRDSLAARRACWGARARALRASNAWPEPFAPGDAARAARLASGDLFLAGRRATLDGLSPFAITPPDAAWLAALHGFDWLDDAQAAGRAERAALRAWAFDWLRRFGGGAGPGWRADLAGRRLARLTTAAPLLMAGASDADKRRLLRAIDAHRRFLQTRIGAVRDPLTRLEAATGLALCGLAQEGGAATAVRAAARLGAAAAALIDGDGGVASRNPQALAEVFAALAWTAAALREGGVAPDPRHVAALGRAGPSLRALRLGDGGLARFHGGAAGDDALLDEAFARAGALARGRRPLGAMGFARLAAGGAVAILDAASPPEGGAAAACALALEVSVGRQRLFGGVGPGAAFGPEWAVAARATAAHAALEIAGASAARLAPEGLAARVFGRGFAQGPSHVAAERLRDAGAEWLRAEHDGYADRFGLIVARRLRLSADGRDLRGEETLRAAPGAAPDALARTKTLPFCVRFHLAPEVAASVSGGQASLSPPDGARWTLRVDGGALSVVDSVSLEPGAAAPRPARQLVISGVAADGQARVAWALTQDAAPPRPARRGRQT